MPNQPKLGPDWNRLWEISAKLLQGDDLDSTDRRWLVDLLQAVAQGENVSTRFTQNKKASPMADRDFWIACDYEQHKHDGKTRIAASVADRWRLDRDSEKASGPEYVRKIKKKQRENVDAMRHLLGPRLAAVIDWHRKALLGE